VIPFAKIKNVMAKIATDLSLTIIRADQKGNAPAFPYCSYKILRFINEAQHQDILEVTANGHNADKNYYYRSSAFISVSVISDDIDEIITNATSILNWFRTVAAREYCKTQEMTPLLLDTNITDRTLWLDSFYQYRYGFDFRLDYTGEYTDSIEAIETIEITPYPDNIEGETITVEE